MSEQQAEQTSAESGSASAGQAVSPSSDAANVAVTAAAQAAKVESPDLVPEQGAGEAPKADAAKLEAPKLEAPKPDAPRAAGGVMIVSSGDRAWAGDRKEPEAAAETASETSGKRRVFAMAAVVALATVAGALGGALATAGFVHFAGDNKVTANPALEATVAKIETDLLNLKVSLDHTAKMGMTQFNKTSDRLDRLEKAQGEPAAKLAKLSEAVEKLRAAAPVAAVPVAAAPVAVKEVTGSITPPAATPAVAEAAKVEVARLPLVEGWVLRDVSNGIALIEGRRGMFEVMTGDPVPGVGRVDAIRRQDGRWVVVTSKGLIVAR